MIVAILVLWSVLGSTLIVGMYFILRAWNRLADEIHKTDPKLREALEWPDRNLGIVQLVGPLDGFKIWRVRMRTLLYGLPETPWLSDDVKYNARQYRTFSLLLFIIFLIFSVFLGFAKVDFLIFTLGVSMLVVIVAGRWPSCAEIERRMSS